MRVTVCLLFIFLRSLGHMAIKRAQTIGTERGVYGYKTPAGSDYNERATMSVRLKSSERQF